MKYDTLMPKDIELYLNGRSWEDLKLGDELDFDSCTGEQKLLNCPGEHGLTPFLTPEAGYGCSVCNAVVSKNASMHGCRECDYDLCDSCGAAEASGVCIIRE